MKIFVDTGAWKALYDKDDSLHELAVQTSHDLKEQCGGGHFQCMLCALPLLPAGRKHVPVEKLFQVLQHGSRGLYRTGSS